MEWFNDSSKSLLSMDSNHSDGLSLARSLSLSLSLPTPQLKQKGNLLSYIWGSSEAKQASALGDLTGQECHQGPFFCSAFLTGLAPPSGCWMESFQYCIQT